LSGWPACQNQIYVLDELVYIDLERADRRMALLLATAEC
jgi:hypothetical protein